MLHFFASVQVQGGDQHVQGLGLLVGLDDGGRFVKGKSNELVRQTQKIGIADSTGHIEGHVIVLWHGDQVVDLLQEFLGFFGLLFQALGQYDR